MNQNQEKARNWHDLRRELTRQLKEHNYSYGGLAQYRTVFNAIEKYLSERNLKYFSKSLGESFILHIKQHSCLGKVSTKRIPSVIRHLNELLENRDFKPNRLNTLRDFPDRFKEQAQKYLKFLELQGKRASTVLQYRRYCEFFLNQLHITGVVQLSDICAQNIYDAFEVSTDKANFCNACRNFMKYLHRFRIIDADLSLVVPTMRKRECIPSTYSKEEIDRLLSCIKKSSSMGKRDYAIILLALRLGLRSGDIAALKIYNIDFSAKIIEIIQEKTEEPLSIALLPEIESAILSHLTSRRGNSPHQNIFLQEMAPFEPITRDTVYGIVSKYFSMSGIETKGRKCGGHALRMTFASELVMENVPYDVVRKILGQDSPQATRRYVRFDIEALRYCAINVPNPSGIFAEKLARSGGGTE